MDNKNFYRIIVLLLILGFAFTASAEMQSDNYQISSSVISSGGGPAASDNFKNDATLGQPSPLMDTVNPPSSDNYENFPGFWYTVAVNPAEFCECDLNSDGSCNGLDWLLFYPDWGRTDCTGSPDPCECDLNSDGSCNGLDWLLFYPDWGRTDCP